jgi:hypothetical protein
MVAPAAGALLVPGAPLLVPAQPLLAPPGNGLF